MISYLSRYARVGVLAVCVVTFVSTAARVCADQSSTNYLLTVSTERTTALYQKGEAVAFKIRLLLDEQPLNDAEVQWAISKDGVPPATKGKLKLAGGVGTVSGKLDEPGFLQCRVSFQTPAKTTLKAVAGAGIDPLQIKPSLPVPADFDEFWSAQKKKLAGVPINAKLTPVESPKEA